MARRAGRGVPILVVFLAAGLLPGAVAAAQDPCATDEGLPDLVVQAVRLSPAIVGDEGRLHVVVQNDGEGPACDVLVETWGVGPFDFEDTIDLIPAGGASGLSWNGRPDEAGRLWVHVSVDRHDAIRETDEWNNEYEYYEEVIPPGHQPLVLDLIPLETPRAGVAVRFSATIFYEGLRNATVVMGVASVEGHPPQYDQAEVVMGPNTTHVYRSEPYRLMLGERCLTFYASIPDAAFGHVPGEGLEEHCFIVSQKERDDATGPLADLRIAEVTPTLKRRIIEGFEVQVTNAGTADSPATTLLVSTKQETESLDVPALRPAEQVSLRISIPWNESVTGLPHDVVFLLDPYDEVWESDEADNRINGTAASFGPSKRVPFTPAGVWVLVAIGLAGLLRHRARSCGLRAPENGRL